MHLNLILSYWSVLCCTATVENIQLHLVIVTYHVLTGNRASMYTKFSVRKLLYLCVVDGVWITTEYPRELCLIVVRFDNGSCVMCGDVCCCNVLIIILMD